MIKIKSEVTRRTVTPVTLPRVTVGGKPISDERMAEIVKASNAIKQKAYRERKTMGGKTWDEFVAETEAAHG